MKKVERNYYIDFLKFLFSIVIVLYHSWVFAGSYGNGLFNRGYYAVDFYFIVSGYLFILSIEKLKRSDFKGKSLGFINLNFLWKRMRSLLPSVGLVFIIGYLVLSENVLAGFFSDATQTELLQLGFIGKGMLVNLGTWYLSVMFLLFFILFPLAYKHKKNFNYYIAPLIIILTIGIVNYKNINICDPLSRTFIFSNGFYKGLIFINLGVIAYEISCYFKKIELNALGKSLFTVAETLAYGFCLANMHYALSESYFMAFMFVLGVSISFSGQSYVGNLFKSKWFEKIGKFGFLCYLCNIPVRTFLLEKFSFDYYAMVIIFLLITFSLAGICYFITEYLFHKVNWRKVLKVVIKEKTTSN